MSEWWYVLVAIVAAGALLLLIRERDRRAGGQIRSTPVSEPSRDFVQEREVTRRAGMSADDQAWESASQQRSVDLQQRKEDVARRTSAADQGTVASDTP